MSQAPADNPVPLDGQEAAVTGPCVSRRSALRLLLGTAGVGILAACSAPPPPSAGATTTSAAAPAAITSSSGAPGPTAVATSAPAATSAAGGMLRIGQV